MPFFWTGGFCGGLLSVLIAGATLLDRVDAGARAHDPLPRTRARDAVSRLAGPGGADRRAPRVRDAPISSSLRPASLAAVLPPAQRPRPGRAREPVRHDGVGRPLLRRAPRRRPPGGEARQLRPPVRGHRGAHRRPRDGQGSRRRASQGEIQLRGPNMMRGICGRTRSELFDAEGWYATGDLGSLDADGYLWYAGRRDDMFKVKGATVYPTEVECGLRSIPGVAQAFVTDVAARTAAPGGRGARRVEASTPRRWPTPRARGCPRSRSRRSGSSSRTRTWCRCRRRARSTNSALQRLLARSDGVR